MFVSANRSQMVDGIAAAAAAAAGFANGTCHRIRMTQHKVPRTLMQDQCDDRMNSCNHLIDSADKYGMFLNCINRTGQKAGQSLNCFLTHLEPFTWNSSQKEKL
jgi:hypothetical protein